MLKNNIALPPTFLTYEDFDEKKMSEPNVIYFQVMEESLQGRVMACRALCMVASRWSEGFL